MSDEIRTASELARDPASVSTATYLWVLTLATLGGAVRVIREVKLGGKSWKQILGIFIAELLTSVFVGLVTFFLCESSGFKPFYTATLVSVASYMGGRALTVLEALYKARLDATKEPHDGP